MGIFSGIFKSRDKPTDRSAGSSYSFFMGNSSAGKYVTERSAMQMTAVRKKRWNIRFIFLLHDEPNPEMTSFIFRETLMTHLLLWGNAFTQIIWNAE